LGGLEWPPTNRQALEAVEEVRRGLDLVPEASWTPLQQSLCKLTYNLGSLLLGLVFFAAVQKVKGLEELGEEAGAGV